MAVSRVQVAWGGSAAAGGGLSSFYFNSAVGTAAQMGSAVSTFLGATEDRRSSSATWSRVAQVETFNVVTGALEGISGLVASSGVGTIATDIMPAANQGLLRLVTGQIVVGRLLRGRLYLPATTESDNSGGAPTGTYIADYEAAAAALIADANTELVVWSQTHGVIAPVSSANVWTSWAVLRSRRD